MALQYGRAIFKPCPGFEMLDMQKTGIGRRSVESSLHKRLVRVPRCGAPAICPASTKMGEGVSNCERTESEPPHPIPAFKSTYTIPGAFVDTLRALLTVPKTSQSVASPETLPSCAPPTSRHLIKIPEILWMGRLEFRV